MTDAYGDGVPVYDLRSHNINVSSFSDSSEGPDVVVLRDVDGNPLQLDDGNINVRAIQKLYSTDPADTPAAITQVVGYDLYVIDDITGDLGGYAFNIDGQLDANRTADPSALSETVSITINPVNDAPYVTGTLALNPGEEDTEYSLTVSDLTANITDVDGDFLNILNLNLVDNSQGSLSQNQDGSWTFSPLSDLNGTG